MTQRVNSFQYIHQKTDQCYFKQENKGNAIDFLNVTNKIFNSHLFPSLTFFFLSLIVIDS